MPCYGLEYNEQDSRCQKCPHQESCTQVMGKRLGRVPVSKTRFQLVPEDYRIVYEAIDFDDPQVADMQRAYRECFATIFGKQTTDSVWKRDEVAALARKHETSVRLYMLAVMTGHRAQELDVVRLSERGRMVPFRPKMLLGTIAEKRFEMFRELCSKEYGAFSLGTLDTLLDYSFSKNSPEQKLLNSELKAGQCIVDFKMATGGPVYEHLYTQCELTLDPLWLAIEPSYKTYILDPYREKPRGSTAERDHRHAVSMAIKHLKAHRSSAIMVFRAREAIMAKAVPDVLRLFGYGADDFLIATEPITDCLSFWTWLGLAIQQDECLRYLNGEHCRVLN